MGARCPGTEEPRVSGANSQSQCLMVAGMMPGLMHTGCRGVWGRTPRGRLWWTHPCDPGQRPQLGAYRTFRDHGAEVALGTEWSVTRGLRKRGLKCPSMGKIQMSRRAPAGGQEEGVGELGARTPISSPPPFSLIFPFISATHTCPTLSEPGIIRAAGSGIIQS